MILAYTKKIPGKVVILAYTAGTHNIADIVTTSRRNPMLWQRVLLVEYERWNNFTTNLNVVNEITSRQNLTLFQFPYSMISLRYHNVVIRCVHWIVYLNICIRIP